MKNSDHKKFEKFHVEISKIWNFSDFFLFYLFQLLFFYAPHQKKFFRDSGHIYECSYSSLGAQKRCVWKRYSKNRFLGQKWLFLAQKPHQTISSDYQSSWNLSAGCYLVPSFTHNFKNWKKKAIRCPKTHKFFKETSYLGIVGCKTQVKFILESWNLYCTCIWLL